MKKLLRNIGWYLLSVVLTLAGISLSVCIGYIIMDVKNSAYVVIPTFVIVGLSAVIYIIIKPEDDGE